MRLSDTRYPMIKTYGTSLQEDSCSTLSPPAPCLGGTGRSFHLRLLTPCRGDKTRLFLRSRATKFSISRIPRIYNLLVTFVSSHCRGEQRSAMPYLTEQSGIRDGLAALSNKLLHGLLAQLRQPIVTFLTMMKLKCIKTHSGLILTRRAWYTLLCCGITAEHSTW